MKCRFCEKEFTPANSNFKFCSDTCRRNNDRKRQRERRAKRMKDPEYREQVNRRWRELYHAGHLNTKKSSREYYWNHRDEILAKKLERARMQRINFKLKKCTSNQTHQPFCQYCGKDFTPSYKGEKYCSPECYAQSPLRILFERSPQALNVALKLLGGAS